MNKETKNNNIENNNDNKSLEINLQSAFMRLKDNIFF